MKRFKVTIEVLGTDTKFLPSPTADEIHVALSASFHTLAKHFDMHRIVFQSFRVDELETVTDNAGSPEGDI